MNAHRIKNRLWVIWRAVLGQPLIYRTRFKVPAGQAVYFHPDQKPILIVDCEFISTPPSVDQ